MYSVLKLVLDLCINCYKIDMVILPTTTTICIKMKSATGYDTCKYPNFPSAVSFCLMFLLFSSFTSIPMHQFLCSSIRFRFPSRRKQSWLSGALNWVIYQYVVSQKNSL